MIVETWIWPLVLLLTLSGAAFSYVKYQAGSVGIDEILKRYPNLSRDRLEQVDGLFDRHGSIVLFLTGIPVLDTIVSLVAGASKVKRGTFILWVSVAKLLRWSLLAVILSGGFALLSGG